MNKIFAFILFTCIALISCGPHRFGEDDHDKIAFQVLNLRDRLGKNSLEELQQYALNIEQYVNNGQQIYGGLHDYVTKLSKDDLMKYILKAALNKKELLEENKFNSVVLPKSEEFLATPKLGGLHDYIWRMDNDTILRWALTANAHNNLLEKKDNKLDIQKMGKEGLIKFTLEMAEKYPGLDSSTELDRLGEKYAIQTKPLGFGGLHDYLYRQPRETLIKWALTAEAHENLVEKRGKVLGGLHDYINSLSDVEIADYVMKKAKKYKELDSAEKLNTLSEKYSISYQEKPHLAKLGGLHDYIFRTERATLIQWALTCEYHDRKEQKLNVLGGLHEYIHTLSNEKIAEYVLGVAAKYPVLDSAENLNALAKKYEIQYNEEDFKKIIDGDKKLKFLQ